MLRLLCFRFNDQCPFLPVLILPFYRVQSSFFTLNNFCHFALLRCGHSVLLLILCRLQFWYLYLFFFFPSTNSFLTEFQLERKSFSLVLISDIYSIILEKKDLVADVGVLLLFGARDSYAADYNNFQICGDPEIARSCSYHSTCSNR